jgi:hypothetical protein
MITAPSWSAPRGVKIASSRSAERSAGLPFHDDECPVVCAREARRRARDGRGHLLGLPLVRR